MPGIPLLKDIPFIFNVWLYILAPHTHTHTFSILWCTMITYTHTYYTTQCFLLRSLLTATHSTQCINSSPLLNAVMPHTPPTVYMVLWQSSHKLPLEAENVFWQEYLSSKMMSLQNMIVVYIYLLYRPRISAGGLHY